MDEILNLYEIDSYDFDNTISNYIDSLEYEESIEEDVEIEDEIVIEEEHETISEDVVVEVPEKVEESEVEENVGDNTEILRNYILYSNDIGYISDNSIISVSDNVIDKPINDYNTLEGYAFLIFIGLFVAGLIYVIRKGVPTWR